MEKLIRIIDHKSHGFYFLYLEKILDDRSANRKWQEHSFYEIMLVCEGEEEFVIENRTYAIKKGDVLLIKPGSHHYQKKIISSQAKIYCLGFLPEAIENSKKAELLFENIEHLSLSEDSPLYPMLDSAKRKLDISKSNASQFLKAVADAAILILCDLEANDEKIDEVKNPAVKRMLEYINENLTSIHKVEDIASALFFSDSYTRTLFKKEMKIGIMEYVRSKKVLLANRKIRHGASPTEIYAECGFSNYTSFYRAYVSQLGHTPRAQLKL